MGPSTLLAAAPAAAPPPAPPEAPSQAAAPGAFARVLAHNSRSSDAAEAPTGDAPPDAGSPGAVPDVGWQMLVPTAPLPGAPGSSAGAVPTSIAAPPAATPGGTLLRPSILQGGPAPRWPGPRARALRDEEPMAPPPALVPLPPPALVPLPLVASTPPSTANGAVASAPGLARAAEPAPLASEQTLSDAPAAALAELAASTASGSLPGGIPGAGLGAPPPPATGAEPAAKRSPPIPHVGPVAGRAPEAPPVASPPRAPAGAPRAAAEAPPAAGAPASRQRDDSRRSSDDPGRQTTSAQAPKQAPAPDPTVESDAPARAAASVAVDETAGARRDPGPSTPAVDPGVIPAAVPSTSAGGAHLAPAGGAVAAQRGPDDLADARETPERQAIASAVSRMTLRRAAHAEVDVPELGRVTVVARERHAEVDVSLSAARSGAEVLRAAGAELRTYLRDGAVPLGELSIGVDGHAGAAGQGAGGDRPRGDGAAATANEPGALDDHAPAGPHRRVRFVL
jgi:hypothetical protein